MAHSNNSVITGKFQGTLGKELVFREWDGKTVVAKAPKRRTGPPTPDQAKTQENFQFGARFAKAVASGVDPALAEAYKAVLKPRQNIYSRALEDFMSVPEVTNINTRGYKGEPGNIVTVRAKDDFRVTNVRLEIYAADGTLLEEGSAVIDTYNLEWIYTATEHNPVVPGTVIKAIATDVPKNEGTLETIL